MIYANVGERSKTDLWFGPEAGPWDYYILQEPTVTDELKRLSLAASTDGIDSVTFQPHPDPELSNQDRYVVQKWDLNGLWTFIGVFDGHAGHETVDFTYKALPGRVQTALSHLVTQHGSNPVPAEEISHLLQHCITSIDQSITNDILSLVPNLDSLTSDQIYDIVNDGDGENAAKVLCGMRGTTVLIALLDPDHHNVWVASLGDCVAVLGSTDGTFHVLSTNHNGSDPKEAERVRGEHPGEPECVLRNRVLGSIAVTRAIGDHQFKLPAIYTEKLFLNSGLRFKISSPIQDVIRRNLTPPYLSNVADVKHISLQVVPSPGEPGAASLNSNPNLPSSPGPAPSKFLMLCSDGLEIHYLDPDSDTDNSLDDMIKIWVGVIGEAIKNKDLAKREDGNLALHLLRHALGGDSVELVSRLLTVEMQEKWMDDVTIVTQTL